jgi:AcrR family transcriptional regulator
MSADTREKIIRASLALFVRKGIAATTTRDIAREAGIPEEAIFRHFPSKEALAEEIYVSNYLPFGRALREAGAGGATLAEKVKAVVACFYDAFDRDPDLYAYLVIAQHTAVDRLPPGAPTPVRVLAEVLRDSHGTALDRKLLTHLALGMILQPARACLHSELPGPLGAQTDAVVAAILWIAER